MFYLNLIMHSLVIFIIFCFTCYSFVNMLLYFNGPFNVFRHIRSFATSISDNFSELFQCPACASTWVSFFISILNLIFVPTIAFTPFNLILGNTGFWWLIILLDGLCGSGTTWLLFKFEDYLVSNTQTEEETNE